MKYFSKAILILVVGFAFSAFAQKSSSGKNINVDFKNSEVEGMTVKMTLPLSFVESLKPKIEEILHEIKVGHHEIDFVGIWKAVKDSGPTEFVEINNEDAHVKVSTTGTHLVVRIDEHTEGHKIDVTLPLALGDAIFENLENINYEGIIDALLDMEGQDLVNIQSETINGRIWID